MEDYDDDFDEESSSLGHTGGSGGSSDSGSVSGLDGYSDEAFTPEDDSQPDEAHRELADRLDGLAQKSERQCARLAGRLWTHNQPRAAFHPSAAAAAAHGIEADRHDPRSAGQEAWIARACDALARRRRSSESPEARERAGDDLATRLDSEQPSHRGSLTDAPIKSAALRRSLQMLQCEASIRGSLHEADALLRAALLAGSATDSPAAAPAPSMADQHRRKEACCRQLKRRLQANRRQLALQPREIGAAFFAASDPDRAGVYHPLERQYQLHVKAWEEATRELASVRDPSAAIWARLLHRLDSAAGRG